MKSSLQSVVWSSIRGRALYQAVTKFHVPNHGRRGKCPGCKLAREMEYQMSCFSEATDR